MRLDTPEGSLTIECGENEYIWDAAAQNGIRLPALCRQGRCLTCAGKLIAGRVDQVDADTYFSEDREQGFVLLCRAKPRTSLHIRTHQESAMRRHRVARGLPAPYG